MKNRIRISGAVALLLLGCARGAEEGATEAVDAAVQPMEAASAAKEPVGSVKLEAGPVRSLEHVTFDVPAGWKAQALGTWSVVRSADGHSRIVVASLGSSDAVVAKVNEAAALVDASEVHVSDPQSITVGADHLPAQAADGWCHIAGQADGRLAYATIDAGSGRRVILVHVSTAEIPAGTREAALTAIGTLRRK